MAHGSNVCGSVQDAKAVGEICERHGIVFVLHAAQTAGHIPVDFDAFHLSALCVPGHKGLLGPSGIGALLMTDSFAKMLEPVIAGGTEEVLLTVNICRNTCPTGLNPEPPIYPAFTVGKRHCALWKR